MVSLLWYPNYSILIMVSLWNSIFSNWDIIIIVVITASKNTLAEENVIFKT